MDKRTVARYGRYPLLLLCLVLFISLRIAGFNEFLDRGFHDAFFRYRDCFSHRGAGSPVVLVGIDRETLKANRKPLVFWGSDLAGLVENVAGAGARVVVMDILHLADPKGYDRSKEERSLEDTVLATENLVVPYALRDDAVDIPYYLLNKFKEQFFLDENTPPGQSLVLINAAERRYGAGFGFSNLMPDDDGIVRQARLIETIDGVPAVNLSFKAVMRYLGAYPKDVKGDDTGLTIKGVRIPLYNGGMIINFFGPPGSVQVISMDQVLRKKSDAAAMERWFRDKIVIIGACDDILMDTHGTPYFGSGIGNGGLMYGPEIVAGTIDTILQGRMIRQEGIVFAFIIIVILCTLGFFLAGRHPLRGMVSVAISIVGYIASCYFIFAGLDLQVGVAIPVMALPSGFAVRYVFEYFLLGRDRKLLGETLKSYIDPRVVEQLVERGDTAVLKGRKREVTVLFSDIRNFTALSERMENPEHVVELLNIYLPVMTGLIMEEQGCVDKFIGDGIMAFWNAPNEVDDHAARAVQCALRMQKTMDEVNERIRAAGITLAEPLRIGIGIHTGHAVVGNIGSEVKHDYTAIGDAVNQASRLEGKTKDLGSSIVVSESVYLLAKDAGFNFRDLGEVQVKGKEKGIKVYGVE